MAADGIVLYQDSEGNWRAGKPHMVVHTNPVSITVSAMFPREPEPDLVSALRSVRESSPNAEAALTDPVLAVMDQPAELLRMAQDLREMNRMRRRIAQMQLLLNSLGQSVASMSEQLKDELLSPHEHAPHACTTLNERTSTNDRKQNDAKSALDDGSRRDPKATGSHFRR